MDYNDKLKLAKEALDSGSYDKETIEYIFPELKESEDERIRKLIIKHFKEIANRNEQSWKNLDIPYILAWLEKQGQNNSQVTLPPFMFDDILALQCCMETVKKVQEDKDLYEKLEDLHGRVYDAYQLEKQGEKKSADKIEPKFKYGDWIIFNGLTLYINEVVEGYYRTISKGGMINSYDWGIDNAARLWTLNEATEGDVLLSPSTLKGDKECIFIFKEIDKNGVVRYNVTLQGEHLKISNGVTNVIGYAKAGYHIPATKEQRDKLEKAMLKAGYKWNIKERKLEKI